LSPSFPPPSPVSCQQDLSRTCEPAQLEDGAEELTLTQAPISACTASSASFPLQFFSQRSLYSNFLLIRLRKTLKGGRGGAFFSFDFFPQRMSFSFFPAPDEDYLNSRSLFPLLRIQITFSSCSPRARVGFLLLTLLVETRKRFFSSWRPTFSISTRFSPDFKLGPFCFFL